MRDIARALCERSFRNDYFATDGFSLYWADGDLWVWCVNIVDVLSYAGEFWGSVLTTVYPMLLMGMVKSRRGLLIVRRYLFARVHVRTVCVLDPVDLRMAVLCTGSQVERGDLQDTRFLGFGVLLAKASCSCSVVTLLSNVVEFALGSTSSDSIFSKDCVSSRINDGDSS